MLAGLAGCGSGGSGSPAPAAPTPAFSSLGCATCHAPDGTGTVFGPALTGKRAFWTKPKLLEYLKNPSAYTAKDPRLSEQAKRFTLPMTPFDKAKPEDLDAVADFVLSLP
jgi:mono/diheme cytochrome c family protein